MVSFFDQHDHPAQRFESDREGFRFPEGGVSAFRESVHNPAEVSDESASLGEHVLAHLDAIQSDLNALIEDVGDVLRFPAPLDTAHGDDLPPAA